MTSVWRAGSRRLNGEMCTRSVSRVWDWLPYEKAPTRSTMASKARGQSSSAPSSRPIR